MQKRGVLPHLWHPYIWRNMQIFALKKHFARKNTRKNDRNFTRKNTGSWTRPGFPPPRGHFIEIPSNKGSRQKHSPLLVRCRSGASQVQVRSVRCRSSQVSCRSGARSGQVRCIASQVRSGALQVRSGQVHCESGALACNRFRYISFLQFATPKRGMG